MRHITLILTLAVSLASFQASAHPGGVDAKGGHVDSKTGKYHLHTKADPKAPAKAPAKKPEAKKKK